MKSFFQNIVALLIISLLLSSCMDDDAIRDFEKLNTHQTSGLFIINEGNFTYSNASLSYYNPQSKTVLNNIFYKTNALPLGDIAQSMCIHDSLAYIVINNSGKIFIINKNTFKYVAKITGLSSPRYIHFVNDNKAYVSDLYSKSITIVDPSSNAITGSIDLNNHRADFEQHNSEQMIAYQNKVYVSCWSYDNKILVINSDSDTVEDSITVGKQPNSIVLDKNNRLWVLSDGGFSGSSYEQEKASLCQIDLSNHTILKRFEFDNIDASPSHLQTNGAKDSLFFIYGNWGTSLPNAGVFCMSINASDLPESPLIPQTTGIFYSLAVDKRQSNIYISNAKDYAQNGEIYRFTNTGFALDTFKVGINPGQFCFDYEP